MKAIFLVFFSYLKVGWFFWRTKKSHTVKLKNLLIQKSDYGNISKETVERMLAYSLFCRFVLELSASYHSMKATEDEKESAFLLGIITPLADDLNDDFGLDFEEIERFNGQNDANVLLHLVHELRRNLKIFDKSNFRINYENLKLAQNDSMKQSSGKILDFKELLDITERKGAFSFLLYRSVFSEDILEKEIAILKKIGFIFQLINDLFDVYKDSHSKTQSTVLNCSSLEDFEHLLNAEIHQLFILIHSDSGTSTKTKEKFVVTISTILARGYVCLNQLKKLQINQSIPFNASQFTREQLICDMEKSSNIWHSFKLSIQLFHKFQHVRTMP